MSRPFVPIPIEHSVPDVQSGEERRESERELLRGRGLASLECRRCKLLLLLLFDFDSRSLQNGDDADCKPGDCGQPDFAVFRADSSCRRSFGALYERCGRVQEREGGLEHESGRPGERRAQLKAAG